MYYINIMSDSDEPDISADTKLTTPISEEIPDSPKEVEDVIESEDELVGDGIPVIEDEDIDDELQEEKEDIIDDNAELQTSNLKGFNTDFNPDDLLLLILLEGEKYVDYLGVVTDITDDYIVLNDERNIYYTEGFIQLIHKDYSIFDIIKIQEVPYDILEKDEIFKEDKIELELIEKKRTEKIYTETEIKEDFISNMINLYNAYDNELLIKSITETAYLFMELVDTTKIKSELDDRDVLQFIKELYKTNNLDLPSYIIPIVGMKKKLFDSDNFPSDNTISVNFEEELVHKYNILNDTDDFSSKGYTNYMNNLFSDEFASYVNDYSKFGMGMSHRGVAIRDCFNDINPCNSINGFYDVDILKIRDNLEIIHNEETEYIVEDRIINMIGFLFIPFEYVNDVYKISLFSDIYRLNDIISLSTNKNIRNIIKKSTIGTSEITDETTNSGYDQTFKKYLFNFDKQLTFDHFKELLLENLPTTSDIIDSLNYPINQDATLYLYNIIYNCDNLEEVLMLLNISLKEIRYDKKDELYRMIEKNSKEYDTLYKKLLKKYIKPIKPVKTITKELDTKDKIKLCQEIIFSQTDLIYQHSLLSKFINIYCREANKESEDKSFFYNKTADSEKLLCKHYLYLINNDKSSFDSMRSIFGVPSKDGNVYCKNCSRFICKEEFSTFEGFSDGVPTSSKEVSADVEDEIDLSNKNVKDAYELITYMSDKFGINLKNDDTIKIINNYLLINQVELYNKRYESDILKTHPLKKNISSLKEFLSNINNILSVIFLIFIQIQISNNSYNINFNNRINLINSDDSWKTVNVTDNEECINLRVITYIESKLKSLVKKYPKETVFNYINDLFLEIETLKKLHMSFRKHFINVIRYWIDPKYNLYTLLDKYFLFESGINKNYIHDYWVNYKPLYDNKLIKHINDYVQSNNELYKKYFVNNFSLQNISLLKSITNDEPKYQELDIKLSELMNNPSFKRMYQYSLKGYGKMPVLPILNLLTKQFIETFTPSHKKELIDILKLCNFNNEKGEYSSITFNIKYTGSLKTVFLDKIIDLDIRKDSDNILKFIHINNFNQEYLLLNSNVIKFYKYTPPKVYITDSFDKLSEDGSVVLEKMFKYYCLDKNDRLIVNRVKEIDGDIINTNVINSFLLDFNEELIDNISECVKQVPFTDEYFRKILNYLIEKNKMELPRFFISYTENYPYDYILNSILKNTIFENRLLDYIDNFYYENLTDINDIKDLLETVIYKKDNNEVVDNSEISTQFTGIMNKILSQNKSYIKNIDGLYDKLIKNDMYSQFNEFQKENMDVKLNKSEKTKLETSIGFTPETNVPFYVNKISEKLKEKSVCDRMIHRLFYYLSFLKNTPNGTFNVKIHKDEWRMSESKTNYISDYLSTNTFLLHNEVFLRNKISDFESDRKYSGFNQYRQENYNIFFEGLYDHIEDYKEDLYKLKTGGKLYEIYQEPFNKFIFIFILNKMSGYIQSLLDDTSQDYIIMKRKCDLIDNTDITVNNCITILSRFLFDIIMNTYEKLYDTNWIYIDSETYRNKLDEHNAREKQQNLDKLDHMTDDKRKLYSVQQQIKSGIMYKESEKENLKRIIDGERDQQLMDEREELKKSQFEESETLTEQTGDIVIQDQKQDVVDPEEDEGYYDQDDFAADGEEDEDNLDALQLNED